MEAVSEDYQIWLDMNADKLRRHQAVEARLGASKGVKFQLEKSWSGKTDIE